MENREDPFAVLISDNHDVEAKQVRYDLQGCLHKVPPTAYRCSGPFPLFALYGLGNEPPKLFIV
jgi:hypothetical protein